MSCNPFCDMHEAMGDLTTKHPWENSLKVSQAL